MTIVGYGIVDLLARAAAVLEGHSKGGIREISTRYFFSNRSLEVVMGERRVPEPHSMDQLMELQSRLRELTEAKKAKWRELGRPLPDSPSTESADEMHPKVGQNGAGTEASDSAADSTGADPSPGSAPAWQPVETAGPVDASRPEPDPASAPVAASVIQEERIVEEAMPTIDSDPPDQRFARRRDATAEWTRSARQKAGQAGRFAAAFWRQAVGQVRDLTGGLGARHAKQKPRPGDPVTAEELIDDRSLGARLLGAAVFFVGLVAIGAVALVQLGKLEVPWLEDNALPAATSNARAGDAASEASPPHAAPGADGEQTGDGGVVSREGQPDAEGSAARSAANSDPLDSGSSPSDLEPDPPGGVGESGASVSEAVSREVREFTRLQGELAFLIGEYEIVRAAFDSGKAGCDELNAHYSSIDSTHLLMSRVVARWREVPYQQVKAYEEISALVDGSLRHYAASGCGLDPTELPDGE